MRTKLAAGLGIILIALGLASPTGARSTPSLPEIAMFARQFWPSSPCYGRETVSYETFSGEATLGQATPQECHVTVRHGLAPIVTCAVLTHELGHLALGPTYFASVNPSDPAHSPDRHNVMYAAQEAFPPCDKRFGTPQQWLAIAAPELLPNQIGGCAYRGYRHSAIFLCHGPGGELERVRVGAWHAVSLEAAR